MNEKQLFVLELLLAVGVNDGLDAVFDFDRWSIVVVLALPH